MLCKGQAPVSLYNTFFGPYDFTMIGNTLNHEPNGAYEVCTYLNQSSATLQLQPNQSIKSAYLYWAGSGPLSTAHQNVKLNGIPITAQRTFTSTFLYRGVFGAFADITGLVQTIGNGTYTFSDLNLDSGMTIGYCESGINFGGWSILIVYEDPAITGNVVKIYDGFMRVDQHNPYHSINFSNTNVYFNHGNKLGFLAWEGDEDIKGLEQIKINNINVNYPPLNPSDNLFNGTNSFTGETTLYNMDMDWFPINNYVPVGSNMFNFYMSSSNDAVIIQNLVFVINTQLPDATISIDEVNSNCDTRELVVEFTVRNTESTSPLPSHTPISFFANQTYLATFHTNSTIPVNGSETQTITLTIPANVPSYFTLTAKVDDQGNGNGIVHEYIETNNTFQIPVSLLFSSPVSPIILI